jgi:hypothetical protein
MARKRQLKQRRAIAQAEAAGSTRPEILNPIYFKALPAYEARCNAQINVPDSQLKLSKAQKFASYAIVRPSDLIIPGLAGVGFYVLTFVANRH